MLDLIIAAGLESWGTDLEPLVEAVKPDNKSSSLFVTLFFLAGVGALIPANGLLIVSESL